MISVSLLRDPIDSVSEGGGHSPDLREPTNGWPGENCQSLIALDETPKFEIGRRDLHPPPPFRKLSSGKTLTPFMSGEGCTMAAPTRL